MTTTSNASFEERVKKYTMWDHEDPEHEDYEPKTMTDVLNSQMTLRVIDPVFGNIWLNGVSVKDFKAGKVKHQW
jgi:hypothetical protein